MKEMKYTDIVCKPFCTFYKEGKEELHCMTYLYLKRRFSPDELSKLIDRGQKTPDFSLDDEIKDDICKKCDFIEDGCDYRAGLSVPPCGGYGIVEEIRKKGII